MADVGSVREVLSEIARRIGLQHPTETARLFAAWAEMVGDDVAQKCQPESLRDGILRVKTDSAAWASQLKYLAPEVARRINQELGKQVITEVSAFVGPRTAGSKKNSPPRIAEDNRRETAGPTRAPKRPSKKASATALDGVSEISDDRLREATKRAHLAAKMRKNRA